MREYPVFVPSRGRDIAAVVAVPDAEPRGLVLLATGGGGVPRSHRFALWTKVARGLAGRGIASVRVEWSGVGDSTGEVQLGFHTLPVDDAEAVTRFALSATAAPRLAMFGHCLGARTVLSLAASRLPCESVALLFLKPLDKNHGTGRALRKGRSLALRLPAPVRRVLRPLYAALPPPSGQWKPVERSLIAVTRSADVLLLEPAAALTGRFERMLSSLNRRSTRGRIRVKEVPVSGIKELAPSEHQRFVVDSVVEWFDAAFDRPPQGGSRWRRRDRPGGIATASPSWQAAAATRP